MKHPFDNLSAADRSLLKKSKPPEWINPMKAVLTKSYFSDPEWIFEQKLDGERCLAFVSSDRVKLFSRNQKPINTSYPEVADALGYQDLDAVIDGEVVAMVDGVPNFSLLQRRMHVIDAERAMATGVQVLYYLFDICYLDGYSVMDLPLLARKALLKDAVSYRPKALSFTEHRRKEGELFLREICGQPGQEGVIAKRADSPYRQGRSKDWLKFKCTNEQEFVVGGFTDPKGGREEFGAMLVGYYDGKDLRYAGKVGTGFDGELLASLGKDLRALEQPASPFIDYTIRSKTIHWVKPKLVAQIGFQEWTPTERLRHPRFLGLRRDKSAKEVVRERPA